MTTTQEVASASALIRRVWEVAPLAGFEPVDVPLLLECHGVRYRTATLPKLIPSMLMPCAEDALVAVVDSRCTEVAQHFYALVELCAWIEGVQAHGNAHRLAAAVCLLPGVGLGALHTALADDHPVFAHGNLRHLLARAGHAFRLAHAAVLGSTCLTRATDARRRGCWAEAMAWYRRTELAGDVQPVERATASLGRGNLMLDAGSIREAERVLRKGLSYARREKLRELAAMHAHDLMVVAVTRGRWVAAERFAALASGYYGPGNPRLPRLAADMAEMWARRGHHLRALPVFEAAAGRTEDPSLAAAWWANAASCAVAIGAPRRASDRIADALTSFDPAITSRVSAETLSTVLAAAAAVVELPARTCDLVRAITDRAANGREGAQLALPARTAIDSADLLAAKLISYMRVAA